MGEKKLQQSSWRMSWIRREENTYLMTDSGLRKKDNDIGCIVNESNPSLTME